MVTRRADNVVGVGVGKGSVWVGGVTSRSLWLPTVGAGGGSVRVKGRLPPD